MSSANSTPPEARQTQTQLGNRLRKAAQSLLRTIRPNTPTVSDPPEADEISKVIEAITRQEPHKRWNSLLTLALSEETIRKYVVSIFNAQHSLHVRPAEAGNHDLISYLTSGFLRGEPPGPFFDEHYYRHISGIGHGTTASAFHHWLAHGVKQRRSPNPFYSDENYLALNPDLKKWNGWLLDHLLLYGLREGRRFHPLLSFGRKSLLTHTRQFTPTELFFNGMGSAPAANSNDFADMEQFSRSSRMQQLIIEADALDPAILARRPIPHSSVPPFQDGAFTDFRELFRCLPKVEPDFIVLVPCCRMGGADRIAGILAASLATRGVTLVIRTDSSTWDRPDFFTGIQVVPLEHMLADLPRELNTRFLYEVIRHYRPSSVFNVNSRIGFETFRRFGKRLLSFTSAYNYYFCSDRDAHGNEVGYPVEYFPGCFPTVSGSIFDSDFLFNTLVTRFAIPPQALPRCWVLRTPGSETAIARLRGSSHQGQRPIFLWAGRFDRQKRIDLVIAIARKMPDIDFHCWGKAVLEATPNLSDQPRNMHLHNPFKSMTELPLNDCAGWLYTSEWDGVPTLLVDVGLAGIPTVASIVGGVGELIDDDTGFPVAAVNDPDSYVSAIRQILQNPAEAAARSTRFRDRVAQLHSRAAYEAMLDDILGESDIECCSHRT